MESFRCDFSGLVNYLWYRKAELLSYCEFIVVYDIMPSWRALFMYDIGISEIKCTERFEDSEGYSIKYDAEAMKRPSLCPNPGNDPNHPEVGKYKLHKHSTKYNLIHDTKSEGKLVFINLKICRYRCSYCGTIIPDSFSFYDQKAHTTNRLREEFVRRCIQGETFSYIARDYGFNHNTVTAAFKAYVEKHKHLLKNDYTPEVLGIDEAHIDGNYRLVLTDVKQQRLLDIKKNNSQRTVKAYLNTLDKSACKCATMDFAPAYAQAVRMVLPDTTVVIDKFHVIQEINRCLDNVRKDIQKDLRRHGEDIRHMKHSRLLFMSNIEDLSEEQVSKIQEWFNAYPQLYEAYMCKETFRDIYLSAETYEDAVSMFDRWLEAVPDFERFSAMKKNMSARKSHILNYWYYPWTNAYTESVNNAIKSIEKAGRGYKFETLRERCLLEINHPKPKRFDLKAAEYLPSNEIRKAKQNIPPQVRTKFYFLNEGKYGFKSKIYDAALSECLELYWEYNTAEQRKTEFLSRMRAYYERLFSPTKTP